MATSKISMKCGDYTAYNPSADIAHNTLSDAGSFTLTAGTWMIICAVEFASNSTGIRRAYLSGTSKGDELSNNASVTQPACRTGETTMNFIYMETVTSTVTRYLCVLQTSGSTLTCSPRFQYFRMY